jgi:hypothetical protein
MEPTTLTPGTIVHVLRGTQYRGAWTVSGPIGGKWEGHYWITTDHARWTMAADDAYPTAAEARAEAKARREANKARRAARTAPMVDAGGWWSAAQLGRKVR